MNRLLSFRFVGSSGNLNDGAAEELIGTFSTLSFSTVQSGSSADVLGFTVGLAPTVASTPEPGTLALLATAGLTGGLFLKRRRRRQ